MTFTDKVKETGFSLDDVVVIGSGLLDQLGLRKSSDLDFVASSDLFEQISLDAAYETGSQNDDRYCKKGELDIWEGWSGLSFGDLKRTAQQIDGVWFVSTDILIDKKQQRGLPKDLRDIELLKAYGADHGA